MQYCNARMKFLRKPNFMAEVNFVKTCKVIKKLMTNNIFI